MTAPRSDRRRRLWESPSLRSAELRAIGERARQVGVLAVVTGVSTGLAVAAFDHVVRDDLFEPLLRAPLWLQALAPTLGLAVAALSLRWLGAGASPATADEYIRAFHEHDGHVDTRPVIGRVVASAATLGAGAAMGFEGPSIYLGAVIGSALQRRFGKVLTRDDAKVLLVCGAAAGVAAIFKAPATGLVFALEVPYRQDLARRMLLPAMFSAAASYVVFVAINGTTPLFPIGGAPPFDSRDLLGAAVLGLVAGAGARVFNAALRLAKRLAAEQPPGLRLPIAGAGVAGLFVLGRLATGRSLVLGSGYQAIGWTLEPHHAVAIVLVVFLLRALATTLAVGAGGVGGLFVPLVVQGALLGSAMGSLLGAHDTTLFPVLGVAAFLGAGYRVPLAAVMFVAESTGRPGFIVPGLIAAACSQLLVGRTSASAYQQGVRLGPIERRLRAPVASAMRRDHVSIPSDGTVAEAQDRLTTARLREMPVVEGHRYVGMVSLGAVAEVPLEDRDRVTVDRVVRTDGPVGEPSWTLAHAITAMRAEDLDLLPVVEDGDLVGCIRNGDILDAATRP